jgi:hypothetical protein
LIGHRIQQINAKASINAVYNHRKWGGVTVETLNSSVCCACADDAATNMA